MNIKITDDYNRTISVAQDRPDVFITVTNAVGVATSVLIPTEDARVFMTMLEEVIRKADKYSRS